MSGKFTHEYESQYRKLNKAQKQAVDTIEGPVMVVAGPGTGKTQILALRIGNILQKTDIKPDGILCMTFTNSGVAAMRERLTRYIGETAEKVNIYTFHSFGMKLIEQYYGALGMDSAPVLLEDMERALFFDEILNGHDWKYLRPRGDSARYYADLKSLISLLARERVSTWYFGKEVEKEIEFLEKDPDSISTRGESKGKIKKEIRAKIESMERTREVARFIELYESAKKEKNALDYDDVLENMVRIAETSPDAAADIRERYLYVLIDEHQDSSRVQNEFVARLWADTERPDIFVVGDDRQLIYGFSGASIDHFKGFKKTFPDAVLITLTDNYRSTQIILDASHALLQSVMSEEKLVSHHAEAHAIALVEADTAADEIVSCALDIEQKIKEGVDVSECAILVPKNAQARSAIEILHRRGVPVASLEALDLFDQDKTRAILRILKIITTADPAPFALSFFDPLSGVSPLAAHAFIAGQKNMREFSFESFVARKPASLFGPSEAEAWIGRLMKWKSDAAAHDAEKFFEILTADVLANDDALHDLVSAKIVMDTVMALIKKSKETNPELTLKEFVSHMERLQSYGEYVPLVAEPRKGVQVLTMHGSKGLEFDYVWIAHMDEWSLAGALRGGFALPAAIQALMESNDQEAVKRKLYVAITRAKRFCTLSHARFSKSESDLALAKVIAELPAEIFEKRSVEKIEEIEKAKNNTALSDIASLVAKKYAEKYVSASLLNNFFECPWKWYFMNLLGLPSSPVETLEFGIAVHAAIDQILKMNGAPTAEEAEEIIQRTLRAVRLTDERALHRMRRGLGGIVDRWVRDRLPKIQRSRRTEESISVKDQRFPHLKIYGKIDLIENLGDKEVRVTDFKTGGVRKKTDIEKPDEDGRMSGNLRQLAMYSYLLANNQKWAADARESRLEFLEAKNKNESFYDRVITNTEIELLIRDVVDYDHSLATGKWVNRPCRYNSYGKNTECEYCRMARIYKR